MKGSWLEAVALPWGLLTVTLAAGVRITDGGGLRFLPPSLASLLAMLLLMSVLIRSGIVHPARLLNERRSGIENFNGAVLLCALAAASAQVVAAVTPEAGLPLVLGVIFLFALFGNTLAVRPARLPALRGLAVAFASAFAVKFIVLDALYAPDRTIGGRLLTGLLEGVTLGTLDHVVWAAGTGYLIFGATLTYFAALSFMPRDEGPGLR